MIFIHVLDQKQKNGCRHQILSYVQRRYRLKEFKGQKIPNGTQSHLGFCIPEILQLVPIPTLPLKHFVLRERRKLQTHDYIPQVFKGCYRQTLSEEVYQLLRCCSFQQQNLPFIGLLKKPNHFSCIILTRRRKCWWQLPSQY